jgi:uncharacterized phage protein (TIGR01671 family)
MREIKYRAWDKLRKQMVLVFRIDFYLNNVDINWVDKDTEHLQSANLDFKDVELMQYTELKDKNKKEVYEGDILLASAWPGGDRGIVKFADGQFLVDFRDGGGNMVYSLRDRIQWGSEQLMDEVIGSVYENPELLKDV